MDHLVLVYLKYSIVHAAQAAQGVTVGQSSNARVGGLIHNSPDSPGSWLCVKVSLDETLNTFPQCL